MGGLSRQSAVLSINTSPIVQFASLRSVGLQAAEMFLAPVQVRERRSYNISNFWSETRRRKRTDRFLVRVQAEEPQFSWRRHEQASNFHLTVRGPCHWPLRGFIGAIGSAAGLSVPAVMLLSLLMFSGASQFAFVGIVAAGHLLKFL